MQAGVRNLPSVDELAASLSDVDAPRALIVSEARRVLARMRAELRAGQELDATQAALRVRESIALLARPSLKRVINATGVILHTNLGRAPAVPFTPLEGYSNLEYDLAAGRRGKRDSHIAPLIERLTGKPAIAVNNNAAAVLLVLNELARGGEAIVSRGELIEIGDGFRIPDIMAASGAELREVGTTNRTHIDDYRAAISPRTSLIMRVHPSNFRIQGFTAKPRLDELTALARERGLPLYEDLGSGCIADLRPFGIDEPRVSESLDAGVNLVSFSGDKLLGGPQAGLIAGDAELVARLRRNPLFRALRLDKLITQALEATLRHLLFERWSEIPALRMIRATAEEIRERAESIRAKIPALEILEGRSVAGGGSTPEQSISTWLLAVPGNAAAREKELRASEPPIIGRIEDDRLVLDLRTVSPEEEDFLMRALRRLCAL
ncbi:MAG TPA: L-seryl-tRNA(Sec) selenium transferase [Bryobacteraceae bacterium]|jgi:L-seryl-tRNA(Ser) seleniumtransferase|nr:L-seryl-tRNA(Sec) selenium transferase [Bryobacteraceae bacterium]